MALKWGVVSAGLICHDFITAVQSIPEGGHDFVAISSRTLQSAKEFALNHNIPRAYGSNEELAKDPEVEVVYIGTINPFHFEVGKLMLESGKHVLMEKPMTLNAKQTKALVEIAKKNKRFLMEAVWSRFFPAYQFIRDNLKKGTIGDVLHINVTFGLDLMNVPRLVKKETGGGSLLDIGIYTLSAVTMFFGGEKPKKIAAVGHLNEDGVDLCTCVSLLYDNMKTANISSNITAHFPNNLVIAGTKGHIKAGDPFWCPERVYINDKAHDFPLPPIGPCNFNNSSGLTFEAIAVKECIRKGALECPVMPHKDSITLAEIMDEVRHQLGFYFPED